MLTKDQILSITDKAVKEVEVPEWGGSVFIRGMTIEDAEYYQALVNLNDTDTLEKMIISFVCDQDGNPLFTEADLPGLKKKCIQALKRIMDQFKEFNFIEGIEKNSGGTAD